MNIGIDIRPLMEPMRTGVGEYTYELLNTLFVIDKENQYFLFYNSNKDVSNNIPKWKHDNVHFVKLNYSNKLLNLIILFLKKPYLDNLVIKNCKLEIKKLDYWFSPNINFISISKKCKHILTIHDLSFEFFPDCFSWQRRLWHKLLSPKKQCQRADIILTPSENTKKDVIEKYKIKSNKVIVLLPGLSEKFRASAKGTDPSSGRNSSEPIEIVKTKYNLPDKFILFLGTLEPRKNIIGIIEAFKNFYKLQATSYKLVIAGAKGWKFAPIMDLINNTEGVKYIGYVDDDDKPALYQLASLFIYPSLYEGFGFPVLEAMVSNTPVITSNRSSLPEVVGDSAYLVNPNNIVEITRAMKFLMVDNELKDLLIEKGKKHAERFNWSKTAKNFIDLIN